MAVVSFSPLQWIFWYDRPDMYQGEPEIESFRKVPTVWDDTRVINGRAGEYATIARRSGEDWFIGTIFLPSIFLPLPPRTGILPVCLLKDSLESQGRKIDDRNMPMNRFPIFLSSMFLSSWSRCESLVGAPSQFSDPFLRFLRLLLFQLHGYA